MLITEVISEKLHGKNISYWHTWSIKGPQVWFLDGSSAWASCVFSVKSSQSNTHKHKNRCTVTYRCPSFRNMPLLFLFRLDQKQKTVYVYINSFYIWWWSPRIHEKESRPTCSCKLMCSFTHTHLSQVDWK